MIAPIRKRHGITTLGAMVLACEDFVDADAVAATADVDGDDVGDGEADAEADAKSFTTQSVLLPCVIVNIFSIWYVLPPESWIIGWTCEPGANGRVMLALEAFVDGGRNIIDGVCTV